ncbi:putative LRR receptor-like serine/threonine-protein kinase [Dorcoceras hygrometricum]|uniref:Putative LRR receptor-like serine/threonine-protein kinase n=1 Tax=Dorcoceras hygrometricum TaxID=472368 RepID=A0A2Z6ZWC4_9LAMI|nr:putative LRR receptor-like serine/threonine-protein kinase [Dorcoceras hygrometricum]
MIELRKRSPTLPRTYQTTAGNEGNCRRKATVNSNLGFEAKKTIKEYFAKYGIWHQQQIQPADATKPAAEISNNINQNDVVEHYLRLVLNQKLDNQTTGLNIAGNLQKLVSQIETQQ